MLVCTLSPSVKGLPQTFTQRLTVLLVVPCLAKLGKLLSLLPGERSPPLSRWSPKPSQQTDQRDSGSHMKEQTRQLTATVNKSKQMGDSRGTSPKEKVSRTQLVTAGMPQSTEIKPDNRCAPDEGHSLDTLQPPAIFYRGQPPPGETFEVWLHEAGAGWLVPCQGRVPDKCHTAGDHRVPRAAPRSSGQPVHTQP